VPRLEFRVSFLPLTVEMFQPSDQMEEPNWLASVKIGTKSAETSGTGRREIAMWSAFDARRRRRLAATESDYSRR